MFDTHCHIHDDDYPLDAEAVLQAAIDSGVSQILCVGTDVTSSSRAVEFARNHSQHARASIGIHPHYAKERHDQELFANLAKQPEVVAVGECGLDYYYEFSPKQAQTDILRTQLELAESESLPLIFHIRSSDRSPSEAFDDFFKLIEGRDVRGVVHSFSANEAILEQILDRGLYLGVNGIVTFMKNEAQINAIKRIPIDKLVVETDAPLLTPVPYRGTVNEPKHICAIIDYLSQIRDESVEKLAAITTKNAETLFKSR